MTAATPCTCPHAGWCERHQCFKSTLHHWLCQHDLERFAEWERGEGFRSWIFSEKPTAAPDGPGLLQRAGNFGQALWDHTLDGFAKVDDSEYERRLALCRACDQCDVPNLICRHVECGCWLTTKARWASATCPLQEWNSVISSESCH
jgi:hypothetical protein